MTEARTGIEMGWVVERYVGEGRLDAVDGTTAAAEPEIAAVLVPITAASLARRGGDDPACRDEAEFSSLMPENNGSGGGNGGNIEVTGGTG